MAFGSAVFLFLFLPVVLLAYCVCPNMRAKNAWLIAASLLFYAFGGLEYLLLLLASVGINYAAGLYVGGRKPVLVGAMVADLGLLCVFKYLGFAVKTLNYLPNVSLTVPSIALPLGISFFTFQGMSYVVDVYRGRCERSTSFFDVMLYMVFFPKLVSGPIVRYEDIAGELKNRTISAEQLAKGLRRFILGLSKKLLIADVCGTMVSQVYALEPEQLSCGLAWLGAVGYLAQIYFDFSGYSDMAIGIGQCFGFHFRENFNYPYTAGSIKEFWRRWHISLSTWFREYLYIPLGGNRKGKKRTYLNKLIVFLCTGLWHGANWTFVVWGLWHGVFIVLEDVVASHLPHAAHGKSGTVGKILAHVYTLLVVLIGFVIFRADSLTQAVQLVAAMFSGAAGGADAQLALAQGLTPLTLAALLCAAVGCLPLLPWAKARVEARGGTAVTAAETAGYIAAVLLLVADILQLASSSYVPFIYFQF